MGVCSSTKLLLTVETARITPEVPASDGVDNVASNRLRVDDDDVVQFSDLIVACVTSVSVSELPPKRKHTEVYVCVCFKLLFLNFALPVD